jgi:hypothetical protein
VLQNDDDWVPVEDLMQCPDKTIGPGAFFCRKYAEDPSAEIVRRAEMTVPAPLAALVALVRPEVFYHHRRPEFVSDFLQCGIDKLIAPGDAYCWARMSEATALQMQLDALLAIASEKRGDLRPISQQVNGEGIFMSMRMALRRDFPQPGHHAACMAFRHPDTGQLLEGAEHAMYFLMSPHEDPGKTRLRVVKRQAPLSSSVASLVVPKLSTLMGKSTTKKQASFMATLSNPEFRSACGPDSTYVVLSLRKCTRGVPLLPLHKDACEECPEEWEQLKQVVPLPEYLRELLRRLEIRDVEVFDSLDGGKVVPYQAVVQQRAWERAWLCLEAPWGCMRVAYRRKLGGGHAPKLEVGTEPKYVKLSPDAPAETVESSDDEEVHGASGVPVRGTFVHYSRNNVGPMSRSLDTGDAAVVY